MVRVEQVLDSWRTIRQDTAAAVEDIPVMYLRLAGMVLATTRRRLAKQAGK